MKPLLFLSQRIPFPPNKGDKIRSFAVLRHLAKSWRVHVGCFIDDPADWQHVDGLKQYCADVCCVPLDKRLAKLRSLRALLTGNALSEPYFMDARLARWVGDTVARHRPEAAFLYSSVMAQYLRHQPVARPPRVVMDFVDVDSDKWRQYAKAQSWPMSWVYGREAERLLAFDRGVAAWADASVFVSEAEADLFRRLAPETAAKVFGISNGIDHAYFTADPAMPNPYPAGTQGIAFTGAMDYWPNVDAVQWFATEMLPAVRAKVPQAVFFIVGGNPAPEVRRLADLPGVTVTGRVADVRPYLAHAAAVVAPMRVARGIQNKVLEGMSMARTVVTTGQGLEGIEALPGRDLLLADGADAFIDATVRVLTDPALAALGPAARARIVSGYGWDDKVSAYERLLAPGE